MKKAKVALVSMLMLAGSGMYAQTNGIGGTVTDNTGEPIIPNRSLGFLCVVRQREIL